MTNTWLDTNIINRPDTMNFRRQAPASASQLFSWMACGLQSCGGNNIICCMISMKNYYILSLIYTALTHLNFSLYWNFPCTYMHWLHIKEKSEVITFVLCSAFWWVMVKDRLCLQATVYLHFLQHDKSIPGCASLHQCVAKTIYSFICLHYDI